MDRCDKKVQLSNSHSLKQFKTQAKPIKKLNLNESVSSLNSWRSKPNANLRLYYSTGKKLSASKKMNKSQFNLPVYPKQVYNSYYINLEKNDYREKLKYLIQKNKNIKKMYQLDPKSLTSSQQKR